MNNTKKIYLFKFFWLFVVVLPILYPYYASLGINMGEFFILQAVFGLCVALFDIPTGYFSDVFGRKLSLCIGAFLSGLGYIILYYATDFWGLFFHEVLIGLGLSFVSGTDIAILYDSLGAPAAPELAQQQTSSALGKSQLAYSTGEALSSLLASVLVLFSFRHVLTAQMILAWAPFFVALTLKEPDRSTLRPHRLKDNWGNVVFIWKHMLGSDRLRRLLAANFVHWFLSTFLAIWLVQKYWAENKIPVALFGVLWGSYNICIGIAAVNTHWLERNFSLKTLVFITSLMCLAGYLGMILFSGWLGICLVPVIYIARGVLNVVYRNTLNHTVPAHLRATANSILSFLLRIGFAVMGPLIGFAVDQWGLKPTLIAILAVFAAGLFIVTLPLLRLINTGKAQAH